jgi:hypothetical protein
MLQFVPVHLFSAIARVCSQLAATPPGTALQPYGVSGDSPIFCPVA